MKDIAMHILDIVQNSIRAEASEITITVEETPSENIFRMSVADNGKGMDEDTCKKATDPWYTSRTTRKIGMGLPLLKMNSDLAGGSMSLLSKPGEGTTVTATFVYDHVDRPPAGDISGTIALLISANPAINIIYIHRFEDKSWSISTKEISDLLGHDAVTDLSVVKPLKEIINENISGISDMDHDNDKS